MARQSTLSDADITYAQAQVAQGVSLSDIIKGLARQGTIITQQGLGQRLAVMPITPSSAPPGDTDLTNEMARLLRIAAAAEEEGKLRESIQASVAYARLADQLLSHRAPDETGHSTLQAWLSEIHEMDVSLRIGAPHAWATSQADEIRARIAELSQVCDGLPDGADILIRARGL